MERNRTGRFVTELQSLLNLAVDGGRGKAGFCSNFPHGLVLGLEVNKLLEVFGFSEGILLAKMIGLTHRVFIDELGVTLFLLQLEEKNLLAIVLVQSGADFNLFDIAEFRTLGALADGDAGVKEVHQFGGAGKVVLRRFASGGFFVWTAFAILLPSPSTKTALLVDGAWKVPLKNYILSDALGPYLQKLHSL